MFPFRWWGTKNQTQGLHIPSKSYTIMLYLSPSTMFKKVKSGPGDMNKGTKWHVIFIGNEAEVYFLDTDTRDIT